MLNWWIIQRLLRLFGRFISSSVSLKWLWDYWRNLNVSGGTRRSGWPQKRHTAMNGSLRRHRFDPWRRHRRRRRHRRHRPIRTARRWVPAAAVPRRRPAKSPLQNPRKPPNCNHNHNNNSSNNNNSSSSNNNNNNNTKLVNANELMATRISTIRTHFSLPSSKIQTDQHLHQTDEFRFKKKQSEIESMTNLFSVHTLNHNNNKGNNKKVSISMTSSASPRLGQ